MNIPNPGSIGPQGIQGIPGPMGMSVSDDIEEPWQPKQPFAALVNQVNTFQTNKIFNSPSSISLFLQVANSTVLQLFVVSTGTNFVTTGGLTISTSSSGVLIGSVGTPLDFNSLYVQSNINAATFGITGTWVPIDSSGASLTFTST